MIMELEFYKRLNIKQIREFLLYGGEAIEMDARSHDERLRTAERAVYDFMHKKFPDMTEYEEIIILIQDYISTAREISMEMGMQSGAYIVAQLLFDKCTATKDGFENESQGEHERYFQTDETAEEEMQSDN